MSKKLYKSLGLTDNEFAEIKKQLNREPNETETYLFSAMWSEHCGYSHSRKYLSRFPKKNALYSDENAGGVKIGNHAVLFKVESHNHPCAIEPYQGAATGIGGIIRDVLALGARPIALLDSLKFGDIKTDKTKHILSGVVKGISVYGNSIGVPTVAGEVIFDKCYETSPIVNVMAVGLIEESKIKTSAAKSGQYVVLVGSHTGRDGIHGASFASKELNENSNQDRPSVQIADPFTKKVLIEATLEILQSNNVLACQDCGAAGLLSSTSEMAYKGECGMTLQLDKVHLQEKNMHPWEIMLSESQERMVFTCNKAGVDEILKISQKYEIPASLIGETTDKKEYKLFWHGKEVANVTPESLNEGVLYDLNMKEPVYIKEFENRNWIAASGEASLVKRRSNPEEKIQIEKIIKQLISDPNIASKNWIFSQYDYSVGNRTIKAPANAGAAGIWLKEEDCFLGLTIDSVPAQVFLNPLEGSKNTVYESFRNLVSSGYEPLGITNCLNFGNPEKPEVGYQFTQAIEGISRACEELSMPVVSGNVSFYNESEELRVYPTPTIGMVGCAKRFEDLIFAKFSPNESIYLIGKQIQDDSNIGGSLYQKVCFDFLGGKIDPVDVELERKLKNTIFELRDKKLLQGAVDVSQGGALISLFEVLFKGNAGFEGDLITTEDVLTSLFGEITGRYIISVCNEAEFEKICKENKIDFKKMGKTNSLNKIKFNGFDFDKNELENDYKNELQKEIESD